MRRFVIFLKIVAWSVVCLNQLSNQSINWDLDANDLSDLLKELDMFLECSPVPDLAPLSRARDGLSQKSYFLLQYKEAERILDQCKAQLASRRSLLENLLTRKEGRHDSPDGCDNPIVIADSSDEDTMSTSSDGSLENGSAAQYARIESESSSALAKSEDEEDSSEMAQGWMMSSEVLLKLLRDSYNEATTKYPNIVMLPVQENTSDGCASDTDTGQWEEVTNRHDSPDGVPSTASNSEEQTAAYQKMMLTRQ